MPRKKAHLRGDAWGCVIVADQPVLVASTTVSVISPEGVKFRLSILHNRFMR